ncbi:MAG TPA: class I SAM-dependent methyltransferase [Candidatus Paceibacterota bacterium]|nr:class I SAM-dependent methyltransferase [Candidatus Paceibacterota bacterium]
MILTTKASKDYELLDSGEGEKLERYGQYILVRPDPQALWPKNLSVKEWEKAVGRFATDGHSKGSWKFKSKIPESWHIELGTLNFIIKPTPFKHVGIFPEQLSNWQWIEEKVKAAAKTTGQPPAILNLFGYTGGATLAAAQAGASVTHLDSSRSTINWAKQNAEISNLKEKPIRWILDDVRKFLKREVKRAVKYDGIIMDPPAFGRGPNGEVWKIEEHFVELLDLAFLTLSKKPIFFLINGYASGYSAIAYENNLQTLASKFGGQIEKGELTIEESQSKRLLPSGIFARWII